MVGAQIPMPSPRPGSQFHCSSSRWDVRLPGLSRERSEAAHGQIRISRDRDLDSRGAEHKMDKFELENSPSEEPPTASQPSSSPSAARDPDHTDEELDPLEIVLLKANSLKELGNAEFRKRRWQPAFDRYAQALAALPLRPLSQPAPKSDQDPATDRFLDDDETIDDRDHHARKVDTHAAPQGHPDPAAPVPIPSSNDPRISRLRSILNANTAACYLQWEDWPAAVQAADASLKDEPNYVKALHRRAQANEKLGTWASLQASLDDYNALAKLPDIPAGLTKEVHASRARLPSLIAERAEADKTEMLAKLKDLGNSVLGKFGMSTDNFKFTPNDAGGYSMAFQQ